jgi:RNA polymerase sigma-70 factor (family 1)
VAGIRLYTLTSIKSYEEKELLAMVAGGDADAFRVLYDQYYQKIYNLGMHLTRSEILSEEIVQDVFIKLWEKRSMLTGINYFNAWLRTIARNTTTDYLRSLSAERLGLAKLAAQPKENNESTQNIAANREYDQVLYAAIKRLSPQQEKVYRLSREQGMKQQEIAKLLGISIYTVKEYMKLALRSIRGYLDDHIDIAVLLAIILYLD